MFHTNSTCWKFLLSAGASPPSLPDCSQRNWNTRGINPHQPPQTIPAGPFISVPQVLVDSCHTETLISEIIFLGSVLASLSLCKGICSQGLLEIYMPLAEAGQHYLYPQKQQFRVVWVYNDCSTPQSSDLFRFRQDTQAAACNRTAPHQTPSCG